ncbi:MAG TPA: NUDIX domain-containing protein [Amaricoccus sp.]|jgi:ADP-ribose pyrophosphatase YjhB (NUDIX family)|nr:NUDIX domain-containing protein [Amaricoccus sp.]
MPRLLRSVHLYAGVALSRVTEIFRPPLSLGVRLLALDDDGGVFLVRHSYLPGLHLPGGAVDADETCREAAVREAAEEGGLVLPGPPELFGVYRSGFGGRRDHTLLYVSRGARQPQPKRASLEILSARFYPLAALPGDLNRPTRERLAEVLDGAPPSETW